MPHFALFGITMKKTIICTKLVLIFRNWSIYPLNLYPLSNFIQKISIEEREYTPEIVYHEQDNTLSISGTSVPEDTRAFYKPVYDWIDAFMDNAEDGLKLNIIFKLDYFNTSSSKAIYELLYKIEKRQYKFKSLKIIWLYDVLNETMLEAGRHFAELVHLPFEYKSYI